MNLFSLKENKNSTRRKGSKMNQQDVLLVEKLRNNKIIEDNYIVLFLKSHRFKSIKRVIDLNL